MAPHTRHSLQSKRPSNSERRNLWKSKTEERKYARDLRRFIQAYGAELKEALQRCATTDPLTGELISVDIDAFKQELDRIKSRRIQTDGKSITQDHAKAGFILGINYSDRTLAEAGVDDGR